MVRIFVACYDVLKMRWNVINVITLVSGSKKVMINGLVIGHLIRPRERFFFFYFFPYLNRFCLFVIPVALSAMTSENG